MASIKPDSQPDSERPPPGSQAGKARLITQDLERPDRDRRSYRIIELKNGMEVLLAHDPKTDMASAAVDVNVGNCSDEKELPGVAHGVEHVSSR